jgi:hypothetical protein
MIKAKTEETLICDDIDATIRAAANLYFSRLRQRWIATHGAELSKQIAARHQLGEVEVSAQYVLGEIEALEDEL